MATLSPFFDAQVHQSMGQSIDAGVELTVVEACVAVYECLLAGELAGVARHHLSQKEPSPSSCRISSLLFIKSPPIIFRRSRHDAEPVACGLKLVAPISRQNRFKVLRKRAAEEFTQNGSA